MPKLIELKIKDRLLFRRGEESLGMVESPLISLELNDFGELAFSIPRSHELYNSVTIDKTIIDLYIDNVWNWAFEIKSIDLDFDKTKLVRAKGVMSYFQHTIMRPFEYNGDIPNFLTKLLNNHNNQVSNDKKIYLGDVTVFDKNNYINRSSGLYVNTWELLISRLLKTHGGYFRIRKTDKYYLDYIQTYGIVSNQPIRFAENMRDLIKYDSNSEIINCLIPLGAELEEDGINGVAPRLSIKSVNDGIDYLKNADSISRYGEKWGTITFDDVTISSNLLAKGKDALKQLSVPEVSIEAKAIDLTNAGYNVDRWNIGDYVHCVSEFHGLDTQILLSKSVIDLANPELDEYYLGRVIKGFKKVQADKVSDITHSIENVQTSNNAQISNVAEHIIGARGGYKRDLFDDKGQTIGTAYMDAPNVESAKNVLLMNQNGIAGTDAGFNGPYRVAITNDGIINADAIRAGTISGVTIDVDTDAKVGNSIQLGKYEDRNTVKKVTFNDRFAIQTRNDILGIGLNSTNLYDPGIMYFTSGGSVNIKGKSYVRIESTDSGGQSINVFGSEIQASSPIKISSDETLKEHIKDEDLSSYIDLIKIKSFNYIDNENRVVGVVAQDYLDTPLEKIMISKANGEKLAVDYNAISMITACALQDLKKRVEELEGIINGRNE